MAYNLNPDQTPGYGNAAEAFRPGAQDAISGVPSGGVDPTNELGQTPPSLFGVAQTYSTGATGSGGAVYSDAVDPTNEPGQVDEGLSGTTSAQNAATGAPGSTAAQNHGTGPDAVKFTRPGSYLTGTNQ